MQINYRWHGHAFPSLDDMFDPEWTATYAAQFLRTLYEERGSWSEAAGAYHSLTPEKAQIYRAALRPAARRPRPARADRGRGAGRRGRAAGRGSARRAARREAQRRAAAERIRLAGPPPAPVMGSVAAISMQPAAGGALLTEGTPLLTQGSPLLTAPGGSLF